MRRRSLLLAVLPLLIFLLLPIHALADAAVVQDSCVIYDDMGQTFIRLYFTIVNFSLPVDVCDLHLIPEPFPALPECTILECGAPAGWSCNLTAGGGAEWNANSPADCIQPGTAKGHFYLTLDPGFCCYVTTFTDWNHDVLLTQEECFTLCKPIGVEESTWGSIKEKYGD
jgi:hypothetical protein